MIQVKCAAAGGVLTGDDLAKYEAALLVDHTVSVRVSLYSQNEDFDVQLLGTKSDISFLGGQVDIDTTTGGTTGQAPWRKLSLSLLDQRNLLHVAEFDSPADYAIWADTFIHVERGDWVSDFGDFAWCPCFFGPVTKFSRSGAEVDIEAQGKELLSLAPYVLMRSITITRGRKITGAIQDLLEPMGEASGNFSLGGSSAKVKTKQQVPRLQSAWIEVRKLAKQVGAANVLWYDGLGQLRMESKPKPKAANAMWAFKAGDLGDLLTVPDESYDFTAFANYSEVTGAAPTKKVPQPHAAIAISADEGLSPQKLSRNGKDRYAVISATNTTVKTQAEAASQAKEALEQVDDFGQDAQFDCLPIPHLEEKDWVTVQTSNGKDLLIQMNKWTIPLDGSQMTVGVHRQGQWTSKLKPKRVPRVRYKKPTRHHH